ncbi:ngoBIM [Symbiodinium sp. CCMP2592]|nr:ngoBIM [Symbiodinium sp. CCMP2592]
MPEFQDQWERLFAPGKGKHALIPDIQNSEVWKARLMAAQQEVLRLHGSQAGVEKVIRALSFSQPRFDSSIRSRAERALQNMNAAALMRCGLTCDYTSECLGFLRRNFDIEDPDVSCTPRVLEEFTKRQRFLFVDGYSLSDSSQVPSSVDGSEAPGSQAPRRCATQLVYEEIQTPEPIFYGNRVHYLCTKAGISDVRQIMGTMAHVVEAMLERLRVDLTEDEIAVALQVFHLRLWQETNRQQELVDSTRKLCDMLKLSHGTAVLFGRFARKLHPLLEAAKSKDPGFGNKHAWSWLLRPAWRARHAHKLPWTEDCHALIAFFLSLKINTTTLERDLGHLLTQLEAHSGPLTPNGSTIASILEVAVEGPQREEEFFRKPESEGAVLTPTDFGVLCGELWIRHFGRRFRMTYNKERKQGPSKPRQARSGTLAAIVRGREAAAAEAAKRAEAAASKGRSWKPASFVPGLSLPLPAASASAQNSVAGTRWAFARPTPDALKHLENFRARTQQKYDGDSAAQRLLSVLSHLKCHTHCHCHPAKVTKRKRGDDPLARLLTQQRRHGLAVCAWCSTATRRIGHPSCKESSANEL